MEDTKVPGTQGTTQAHTAGPWETGRTIPGQVWADASGLTVARAYRAFGGGYAIEEPEMLANARLIAAAPDLLEALLPIVTADGGGSFRNLTGMNAQLALAAISKATGR
jgi:hypothetical protein